MTISSIIMTSGYIMKGNGLGFIMKGSSLGFIMKGNGLIRA